MNSQKRVKIQVWLLIALVFVLGGVTGAAVDRIFVRAGSGKHSEGSRRGFGQFNKMKENLNLTEGQEKSIRAIFEENRKDFRTRLADCPGVKELRERADARIKDLLTSEQRTK